MLSVKDRYSGVPTTRTIITFNFNAFSRTRTRHRQPQAAYLAHGVHRRIKSIASRVGVCFWLLWGPGNLLHSILKTQTLWFQSSFSNIFSAVIPEHNTSRPVLACLETNAREHTIEQHWPSLLRPNGGLRQAIRSNRSHLPRCFVSPREPIEKVRRVMERVRLPWPKPFHDLGGLALTQGRPLSTACCSSAALWTGFVFSPFAENVNGHFKCLAFHTKPFSQRRSASLSARGYVERRISRPSLQVINCP